MQHIQTLGCLDSDPQPVHLVNMSTQWTDGCLPGPRASNCKPVVKYVNGEYHIAIHSTRAIQAGKDELLMDYGSKYRNHDFAEGQGCRVRRAA